MKLSITALAILTSLSVFATEQVKAPAKPEVTVRPSLVADILSRPIQQTQSQQQVQALRSGTGIGGGVVFEGLIAWCDQASGILHDARVEARESWGLVGNPVDTLEIYRNGLTLAIQSAPEHQTQGQVFTLRYVQRGLTLSQILGVDDILAGRSLAQRQTESLVNFFDWYLGFTRDVGQELDRQLYIPYLANRHCNDCHETPVRTIDIERRTVELSISALRELDARFVHTLPDRSNLYSSIGVTTYLKALSYLLRQVAGDLRETLFAESFVCQASRMEGLSEQINRFLNNRQGNSQDAIRLNRFSLTLKDIVTKLSNRGCF
jgi:hypothetical protein